jgi:hypothetical protein
MKLLLSLMVLLATPFSTALAAEACITGIQIPARYQSLEDFPTDRQAQIYLANYSCQDIEMVSTGLKALGIVMNVGALSTACSIGGVPVSIILGGAAAGLNTVDLYVSSLDCTDFEAEEKRKQEIDEAVCRALNQQGIECQPPLENQNGMSI